MTHILEMNDLAKNHPDQTGSLLFSHVTSSIDRPEIIALLGASGQGKSTLLRILSSLDRPDQGTMTFQGKTVEAWEPRIWRTRVCYVGQQAFMLPGSIEDNVRIVSKLRQSAFDRSLAEELINRVGLGQLEWSKNAEHLSGGEKQRLALVRSMLVQPEVLLLDEVTSALDAASKQLVEDLLLDWHRRLGTTIIWVTHELEQAKRVSSRVWFMGEGTLLEDRDSSAFFTAPITETGKRFLHMSTDHGGAS
ncbi:ABC transporter ATP-binding protein [Paenibacillus silviterrae]|uniref:ABC transporter ATP-binding protein n=1 Tax=Paenibacillus silviterrae TaxID=3242194 RepID=UPI0025431E6B|nr:ATP-binding cassette domain-containing protein [Paenibacillus chinjuensis]